MLYMGTHVPWGHMSHDVHEVVLMFIHDGTVHTCIYLCVVLCGTHECICTYPCDSVILCSRDPDLYLWKMDRTENFSRMRLKLARNYNYNKHTDASQHSSGETPLVSSTADTSLLAMATATKSPSEEEEEHLFDQIQKLARDEPAVALEKGKKEKLMIREMCQLVTVVEVISGTLDITNRCIYFVSDAQDKDAISISCECTGELKGW